ncbi:ribonuclease III [uncultured Parabacteroides sp.]|uniref:ribonuclease III n=1 Tax=uncultured Parabacteroides sp. TaxID=512312 RepID=UPI00262966EF|nr:ribonuclease III [uncultured Parabacteroides sp.]
MNKNREPYFSLLKVLNFYPDDIRIYEQALLHRSSSISTRDGISVNNERLEFLGDAILSAVVAAILYKRYPNRREGFLTDTRSKIVKRDTMNEVAIRLGLDRMIVCSAKVCIHKHNLYGNALEALIGAIYVEKGYDACYKFIHDEIIERCIDVELLIQEKVNFKSNLVEWGQKNRVPVIFDLIDSTTDEDGAPVFHSAVSLFDEQVGVGVGYSKKESQQAAAKMALIKLREDRKFRQHILEMKKYKARWEPGEDYKPEDSNEMDYEEST